MLTEVLPPPYVITLDDKRGLIVVITATTLSFVWTCFLIRIYLRVQTREWRSDDYFLAAASVLGTVQSALVLHIVDEGIGRSEKSLSGSDLNQIGRDDFASQILYIITLFLSKCAVIFLYLRLSPGKGHTIASWGTLTASGVWTILAIVLVSVPCNPLTFWTQGPTKCTRVYTRWQAIGAIDIITEACIFLISVYLVAGLNMATKSKVMVIAAFSARLPVIAAAAARLFYLSNTLTSPNRTLYGSYYIVATQWQLGYAIMSSTITGLGPFLRPFSKSFSTSYHRSSYSYHHSKPQSAITISRSNGDTTSTSYQMDTLQARAVSIIHGSGRPVGDEESRGPASSQTAILPAAAPGLNLRPDEFRRDTAVSGGEVGMDEEDAMSRLSDESRRMMIRKKTVLTVQNDRASEVGSPRWKAGVDAV
ncbi:uncharacterized protein BDR25DRAFT_1643 [Lindgomyces ingoldianus]|uniref:Uncharacterized protein n=1 Tax=Lindgomyces ingoldianus TaxID=673940 RepID=A0ACB6RE43_9PLEO|nr:uncharacterized protein BDR25DRAFT_1643 [Lindgomyces ingoldianus]KAF2477509.1 hypothetical protein BDR25DRAFT_1643 [Lindgomyces ingoldianus]